MMNIVLSLTEGRVIRDLFENGFLEMMQQQTIKVLCFTPAAHVPEFVDKWSRPCLRFYPLSPYAMDRKAYRALHIRQIILRRGKRLLNNWRKLEPRFFPVNREYVELMRGSSMVVITHPMYHSEMPVFRAAIELSLPTLGVLRSWDNLHKGLRIYTDKLAVWNPVNFDEARQFMGYSPENVEIVGGAQFDPYFDSDQIWSRQMLAESFHLDATRLILTLATLGSFLPMYDETYLVDVLLQAIDSGSIPGRPQLIIRLHPASRLEQFQKYTARPDVRLSYVDKFIPGLAWTMSREDVVCMANLLRHSDVVISPGSTITIETAIFDTPTIVPIFHTYQPELGKEQYDHHLRMHFRRLAEQNLIPLIHNSDDLIPAINRCLSDRTWYRAQRAQLVKDYIYYTDGRSTQRLADLIVQMAGRGK